MIVAELISGASKQSFGSCGGSRTELDPGRFAFVNSTLVSLFNGRKLAKLRVYIHICQDSETPFHETRLVSLTIHPPRSLNAKDITLHFPAFSPTKQPDRRGFLAMGHSRYQCSTETQSHFAHRRAHQSVWLGRLLSTGRFLHSYAQSRLRRTHSSEDYSHRMSLFPSQYNCIDSIEGPK